MASWNTGQLYLDLAQRPRNAASNVPLSSRIFNFQHKMLDNRECGEPEAELELQLYLMTKAFAERVGVVWPLDFSGAVADMGICRATASSNPQVFIVTEKCQSWSVPWTILRACLL